jgi:hypothetical protein
MATVDVSSGINAATHPSRAVRSMPYVVETTLNFATATTTKGSALAAADVLQVLDIPAETLIINAGYEVTAAITGDVTLDVGVTGIDADVFVDGATLAAATSVGAYAQNAAAFQPVVIGDTADTLDVLIATSTTAVSAGTIRVWAVLVDLNGRAGPASVDREQLA